MPIHRRLRTRRSRVLPLLIVVATLLTLAAPCRADNPPVSLKVENATCAEATAQLSKAAGVSVQLYTTNLPPGAQVQPNPDLEKKASFDWSHATFAQALRQLCEHYNLRPGRQMGGGYLLWPAGNAPPLAAEKPVGLFEKNGLRLSAQGVQMMENRSISFVANGQAWNNASTSVTLQCRLAAGDADSIAGIENATAKDDRGNLLVSAGGTGYYYGNSQYPDEWTGSV